MRLGRKFRQAADDWLSMDSPKSASCAHCGRCFQVHATDNLSLRLVNPTNLERRRYGHPQACHLCDAWA
jgi:hypothetical protein